MSDFKPVPGRGADAIGGTVRQQRAGAIGGTVRQRAADELRNRIITGRLAPGARLDLDEITAEFGTSRTPVREALLELSHEGLVLVAPRSGITVLGITPHDAVDNFALLATLSGRAAEWATERAGDDQLDELVGLAGAIADAVDVVAANWRFHRALNTAARSPRLLTFIRQAVRAVPSNYFELFPEQEQRAVSEHATLLEAMGRRDARAARFLAEDHVLRAGEALASWIAARQGG